jgi:L-rhamnonate dehydratase
MKITDVSLFQVRDHWTGPAFPPGDRQARQLDIYPEFNRPAGEGGWPDDTGQMCTIYVEICTDEGVSGLFGPIDESQAFVIQRWLRPFLIGRDPLANELLLDQMLRLDRHGRSGLFMTGMSPVDCALWDLKGKAWDQPVVRLLGGPARPAVPAYASMLGFSVEPEAAAQVAREYKEMGFPAQKWFFRYGPGDGERGKERNLAMARAVREAVGSHYALMFDAFMGWDVPYAVEMVKALAPLNPAWIEEPIPPERIGGLRKIREAAGVPVVAHGHSLLAALHVAGSQSPVTVPLVEFLIQHQERKQFFHAPIYRPVEGSLELPALPGLGLVLDEGKIEAREPPGS